MEIKDKLDVIKHIKLGIKEVLYFNYRGDPLPLRPISSYEMDQCFYKALRYAPEKIANFVINLKLGFLKEDKLINVSKEGYADLLEYYNTVNYWVVYYAMKDFQNEDFSKPDYNKIENFPKGFYLIRNMQEIHEIAKFVEDSSCKPKEVVKEIFKDELGREIAYAVYFMNIPLGDFNDLTKLQKSYLVYSKGKVYKVAEEDRKSKTYSISGTKMSIEELKRQFG